MDTLQTILKKRILVLDGAMGTMIQSFHLTEADYRGTAFVDHPCELQGNNDLLSLTRPDVIKSIHRQYLQAGADILETNTFNANAISQGDYQLEELCYQMNYQAVILAREVADSATKENPNKPRFVCGILGPTNRMASLSPDISRPGYRNVTFDELSAAYITQTEALLAGGVDLLMVETVFDSLNAKAALWAILTVFEKEKHSLPIIVSGTVSDASGRILSGQTLVAFWYTVRHANLLGLGLNCALGVTQMRPYLEELAPLVDANLSVHPNAGLPNTFGEYEDQPEFMAEHLKAFAEEGLVNIVGGCCGSTPDHIQAITEAVQGLSPRLIPQLEPYTRLSGLEPLTIRPDSLFVNIGERANVTGSAKFRHLIKSQKYEMALKIAEDQITNGAQILDVNMDEGLLDSEWEMENFLRLMAMEPNICKVPFMIDSSKWSVLKRGLKNMPGKGIVNSISLKVGEDVFLQQAQEIQKYGAAVIVMAFDEDGQADTYERKIAILNRSYQLLTQEAGFPPEDIIFDPNIFAVATGIPEHNNYALAYLEACKTLKRTYPHSLISGGVSNLSFSFRGNNALRKAMHSVFIYHAIKAGMDMGIVHAGQLMVYDEIDPVLRTAIEDVLFNRYEKATETLLSMVKRMEPKVYQKETVKAWRELPIEARLSHALIEGVTDYIIADTEEAYRKIGDPLKVIEGPLLDGMNQVGELFGAGKMFLPQVVKSARVMKQAVSHLEQYLQTGKGQDKGKRGKILLATVKGDVHDIGKNIVGVVLGCNHFDIVDLGVMVPAQRIVETALKQKVNIVGLSGLITPSLEEMVNVAKELNRQQVKVPLLIGGATTSRTHTAVKIEPAYHGPVVHVKDASQSAGIVNQLLHPETHPDYLKQLSRDYRQIRQQQQRSTTKKTLLPLTVARERKTTINWEQYAPPTPIQKGLTIYEEYPLPELLPYIDWTPFFMTWELKGKYPEILKDPNKGQQARRLYQEAQEMLSLMVKEKRLTARAVVGLFPANAQGDDVEIYTDEDRNGVRMTVHFLRQQSDKGSSRAHRCLTDYIVPREKEKLDWIGAFAVTTGIGLAQWVAEYEKTQDDFQAILAKSLADRLVEALAEHLHERVRRELWGYSPEEDLEPAALLKEKYRGIRPAPGYPACPDHTEKQLLFDLLKVTKHTSIQLTDHFAMTPPASICGWYFSHPAARYFGVGKIGKDQVTDYAHRKGMAINTVEQWLAPNLAYDPRL